MENNPTPADNQITESNNIIEKITPKPEFKYIKLTQEQEKPFRKMRELRLRRKLQSQEPTLNGAEIEQLIIEDLKNYKPNILRFYVPQVSSQQEPTQRI